MVQVEKLGAEVYRRLIAWFERMAYPDGFFLGHIRATRALLKFCEDHRYQEECYATKDLDHIRECLQSLERGEKSSAVESFRRVPFGKEGFGDWWPSVVFKHENEEYVWAEFEALVERWYRLMSSLASA